MSFVSHANSLGVLLSKLMLLFFGIDSKHNEQCIEQTELDQYTQPTLNLIIIV